jgi:hypothetical protein
MGAAQQLRINYARQVEIIGKYRFAGTFRHGVDFPERLADDG